MLAAEGSNTSSPSIVIGLVRSLVISNITPPPHLLPPESKPLAKESLLERLVFAEIIAEVIFSQKLNCGISTIGSKGMSDSIVIVIPAASDQHCEVEL